MRKRKQPDAFVRPNQTVDLIRALKALGFVGPYSGGEHQYLVRGELRLVIPNPHQGEIGKELLARILRQARISREDWEKI